jgi:hypothetical protein
MWWEGRFAREPDVDFLASLVENRVMKTPEKTIDTKALLERLAGKPLDPVTYQRIRERQEAITAELRKQHGEMDIAVSLLREVREEQ